MKTAIAVAEGDGVGPEIMQATLHILASAGAELEIHKITLGERAFLRGFPTGIEPAAWEVLKTTRSLLKGPTPIPQGSRFKSVSKTLQTALDLYAHIRPCLSYHPIIFTKHPEMNVVIIHDNEEDLSTEVEYRQTPHVCTALKMISRAGSERIIRCAFEYAKQHQRKKVTAFAKDNILKYSDGLFRHVFEEVAKDYPDIVNEYSIVDLGGAKLADCPEDFDVIVMPNLYGELFASIATELTGCTALSPSINVGDKYSLFQAAHPSLPSLVGQNSANPSGLLLAAIQMLIHLGQIATAERIHNSWLKTLEEGIHTLDIYREGMSKKKVGTQEFGEAVVKNLGEKPNTLPSLCLSPNSPRPIHIRLEMAHPRHLIGVDVTLYHKGPLPLFFPQISHIIIGFLRLRMITNRGAVVWPESRSETFCIEQWRCRFTTDQERTTSQNDVIQLLKAFDRVQIEVIRAEMLYLFEGSSLD